RISKIEAEIYEKFILWCAQYIQPVELNAQLVAQLDCLQSYTQLAIESHYVRPELEESFVLEIKDGRHPVIDKQLPIRTPYIARCNCFSITGWRPSLKS